VPPPLALPPVEPETLVVAPLEPAAVPDCDVVVAPEVVVVAPEVAVSPELPVVGTTVPVLPELPAPLLPDADTMGLGLLEQAPASKMVAAATRG
jgi:hypothetical protein